MWEADESVMGCSDVRDDQPTNGVSGRGLVESLAKRDRGAEQGSGLKKSYNPVGSSWRPAGVASLESRV